MANIHKGGHQKKQRPSRRAQRGLGKSKTRPSKRLLDREIQELKELIKAYEASILLTRIDPYLDIAVKKGGLYEVEVELPQISMEGMFRGGVGKPHIILLRETKPPFLTTEEISPDMNWTIQTRGQLNHLLKRLSTLRVGT